MWKVTMDRWLKSGTLKRKDDNVDVELRAKKTRAGIDEAAASISGSTIPSNSFDFATSHVPSPEKIPACSNFEVRPKQATSNLRTPKTRKYEDEYLKFGFFWTGDQNTPHPQCIFCFQVLSNEALKPSKLKRHFESKHSKYADKSLNYSKRKYEGLFRNKSTLHSHCSGEENTKAAEASYGVALLIVQVGKDHTNGETLVKPALGKVINIALGTTVFPNN